MPTPPFNFEGITLDKDSDSEHKSDEDLDAYHPENDKDSTPQLFNKYKMIP